MKYKQESYARKLYRDLKAQFYGDQNIVSKLTGLRKKNSNIQLSIEGGGVHWKCMVVHGQMQCHIHCFDYDFVRSEIRGAEYYTYFKLNDDVIATGRTQSKQQTIDAVTHWCNNEPLTFLYKHFEFIDREKRSLISVQADIIGFYAELSTVNQNEIIEEDFYSYHLLFKHKERSCTVHSAGYKSTLVFKFLWDETQIFETSTHDIARVGLLIKQWVVDGEKPSVLAEVFTEISFGKLAEYYEKGNPLEGEFLMSWDGVEAFYKEVNLAIQHEIMKLIKLMRNKGFDKTLRAGTSLYDLMLSRSRRHGLRNEQHSVIFCFHFIKSVMEVRTGENEVLTFGQVAYNDTIDAILKKLEQQPVD